MWSWAYSSQKCFQPLVCCMLTLRIEAYFPMPSYRQPFCIWCRNPHVRQATASGIHSLNYVLRLAWFQLFDWKKFFIIFSFVSEFHRTNVFFKRYATNTGLITTPAGAATDRSSRPSWRRRRPSRRRNTSATALRTRSLFFDQGLFVWQRLSDLPQNDQLFEKPE